MVGNWVALTASGKVASMDELWVAVMVAKKAVQWVEMKVDLKVEQTVDKMATLMVVWSAVLKAEPTVASWAGG